MAVAPTVVPLPAEAGLAAASGLGVLVIAVLFDLEKTVIHRLSTSRFEDFHDVAADMRAVALRRAGKDNFRLDAIGMSMGHAWTLISGVLDTLLRDTNARNIQINISMLDPTWPELHQLNPGWAARAPANHTAIVDYIARHQNDFNQRHWTFALHTYRHMPNWHGICLDDQVLFLSTCSWQSAELTGGENEYERLERGSGDKNDRLFAIFRSWSTHIAAPPTL